MSKPDFNNPASFRFADGIRHIVIEVSSYDENWVPRAFMSRLYPLDSNMPIALATRGNPVAALWGALEEFARVQAAEKPKPGPKKMTHELLRAEPDPEIDPDLEDLI